MLNTKNERSDYNLVARTALINQEMIHTQTSYKPVHNNPSRDIL